MTGFIAAKTLSGFPAALLGKPESVFAAQFKVRRLHLMDTLRTQLLSQVQLSRSRVKPYEGFIFLCGGRADVTSPKPISIRDAICREFAGSEIIDKLRMAEHYKDWAHDAVYSDLVSFESHLAELSSVIVLILESPGAIAELGLFASMEDLRSKLLVFIDKEHYRDASFIRLGPIDFLEKNCENKAECHAWLVRNGGRETFNQDMAEHLRPDLVEAIKSRISRPLPEESFNCSRWLHVALLICDILNLFSALTIRELADYLRKMGVDRSESDVRQFLFVLEKMELLVMEPSGAQRFFICIDGRQFLVLHLESRAFDLDRFRSDVLSYYRKNDKKRFRAIQAVRGA